MQCNKYIYYSLTLNIHKSNYEWNSVKLSERKRKRERKENERQRIKNKTIGKVKELVYEVNSIIKTRIWLTMNDDDDDGGELNFWLISGIQIIKQSK